MLLGPQSSLATFKIGRDEKANMNERSEEFEAKIQIHPLPRDAMIL